VVVPFSKLLVEDVVADSCLVVALSLSSSEWAPKASVADTTVVALVSDVGSILYVAMLADEQGVRPDVVVSALVAPKPLVVLRVVVVGGGDANCVEVVLVVDVVVNEGVVVGPGGTDFMVMSQACDGGVDMASCAVVIIVVVGFAGVSDGADVDVFNV